MDAVRALEVVDLMDRDEVYRALRTVLVTPHGGEPAFDRCFEAFWRFQAEEGQGLEGLVSMVQPTPPRERARRESAGGGAREAGADRPRRLGGGEGADDGEPLEVPGHERIARS